MASEGKPLLAEEHFLEDWARYFQQSGADQVLNVDQYLPAPIRFQIQRLQNAVQVFGGTLPPSRFSHYYVGLFTAGSGRKSVGLTAFDIRPHTLIFIPSGIRVTIA